MSQTPREVIRRTIADDGPDRIGLFEAPWRDTLEMWARDSGYPTHVVVREDPDHPELGPVETVEPISPADHFGFDLVSARGNLDMLPILGYNEIVEETDEWIVRRNGAGGARRFWKNKSGTPEHIDFRMSSRGIWERDYRPHLLELNPERFDLEETRERLTHHRAEERWVFYGQLFIWENMRQSMGDVTMYSSLALDPGWIHDYNRVYTDFYIAHYKYLMETVGVPDGFWMYEDLGYKNGLFCSPKMLGELIFPYFAEVIDFFHSYGVPVVLHSCGNFTDALPLIVDAGFDAVNPMEVKAGCDIISFAENYGDKLTFMGGLDARFLESGDRALIRREVTRFIQGLKERGARFVFASDHSLSTLVTYESYAYALEVYREQMWY